MIDFFDVTSSADSLEREKTMAYVTAGAVYDQNCSPSSRAREQAIAWGI